MIQRFTVHTFEDLNHAGFDPKDYSGLKFGSGSAAKKLGYEMADKFWLTHRELLTTQKCVVVPAAFKVVEIAASLLAKQFMHRLNHHLVTHGYPRLDYLTTQRNMNYTVDYSTMTKEQRQQLLLDDTFSLNEKFIEGKTLILIDDVLITGTHEQKLVSFLDEAGLKNPRVFAYYATYTGEIADIESRLNLSGLRSIQDYINLASQPDHHLVVRAVRFLLDGSVKDLRTALIALGEEFVEKFYHAAIAQDYYTEPKYQQGFDLVKQYYAMT